MKRFMTTLLAAGLALLVANTASAELFQINRTVVPTNITHVSGGGNVKVDFSQTAPGYLPTPPIESNDPGNTITVLNYQLFADPGASLYTFNPFVDTFTLTVDFKSFGPVNSGAVHTETFNGSISGQLSATNNTVSVSLTPTSSSFLLGTVPFTLSQYQESFATVNPGSASEGVGGVSFHAITPVPEPGSMALLAMGGLPFLGMIRRRRK